MTHRKGSGFIPSIDGGSCRLNPARRAPPARAARLGDGAQEGGPIRRALTSILRQRPRSPAVSRCGPDTLRITGRRQESPNEPGRFRNPAPPRGGLALFGDPHFTGPGSLPGPIAEMMYDSMPVGANGKTGPRGRSGRFTGIFRLCPLRTDLGKVRQCTFGSFHVS
jgi:hypothetical protein